jgi:hypothetical protein
MWSYPRPAEKTLSVEREPVSGSCSACGADDLAAYPVISDGGWWSVVKCQECLTTVSREKGPLLGSYTPLGTPS